MLAACDGPAVSGPEAVAADAMQAARLEPAALLAASCSGCHRGATAANGEPVAIPGLEGLSAKEIAARLEAYATEPGGTSVMHRIARGYTASEREQLAAYLGGRR